MVLTKVEKRYVVWVSNDSRNWRPTTAMSEAEANAMAYQLDIEGRYFRVAPAPKFDPREDE